jgi:hypothetical protein
MPINKAEGYYSSFSITKLVQKKKKIKKEKKKNKQFNAFESKYTS